MEYRQITDPFPGVVVDSPSGTASYGVFDHGAHTFAWQPAGHRPVLWLSAHSEYSPGRPVRGGVPVVFPWFGAGLAGTQTPAHGPARLATWTRDAVVDALSDNGTLSITHTLKPGQTGSTLRAELKVTFSPEQLVQEFTVSNEGSDPATWEQALHTYFAVSDVRQVSVTGLEGASYLDRVPGAPEHPFTQVGPIEFVAETDRIYRSQNRVELHDPGWGRTIVIDKQGSADTVVWNPWIAKAAAMPDFGDHEWPQLVCIEVGNLGPDAITLRPGETHRLVQTLSVTSH